MSQQTSCSTDNAGLHAQLSAALKKHMKFLTKSFQQLKWSNQDEHIRSQCYYIEGMTSDNGIYKIIKQPYTLINSNDKS